MVLEFVQIMWDLFNSFTGSTYLSAFLIFIIGYVIFLFIFQGDFELALVGDLLLVFIISGYVVWLKVFVIIILGIWASYKIIDLMGQRGG